MYCLIVKVNPSPDVFLSDRQKPIRFLPQVSLPPSGMCPKFYLSFYGLVRDEHDIRGSSIPGPLQRPPPADSGPRSHSHAHAHALPAFDDPASDQRDEELLQKENEDDQETEEDRRFVVGK